MTIQTQVTDRKSLAKAIAEELGTTARYMGVPGCGYQIGDYVIDRDGNLIGEDFGPLQDFLLRGGYISSPPPPRPRPVSDSEAQPDESCQINRMDITVPAPEMTVGQLKNLVFLLYSKQYLISKMTHAEILNVPDILVERLKDFLPESPQAFTEMLDDAKAVAELDGFDYRDGQFTMSYPCCETDPERWTTYAGLTGRILQAAKDATRFFPVKQEYSNEKYHARSWLLRLGYGGPAMKAQRDLLLKHLKGYSAFPNENAAEKHKEKYAALREEHRQALAEEKQKELMTK